VKAIQREQVNLHLDSEDKTLALRADLAQPAKPPNKVERRRAEGSAQPGNQAEAQNQNQEPSDQDRAQNQGGEAVPAPGGEVEEVEPRTE
jgi:hypothetical protein